MFKNISEKIFDNLPAIEAGELPVLAWDTCSLSRTCVRDTRSSAAAKLLLDSFWYPALGDEEEFFL